MRCANTSTFSSREMRIRKVFLSPSTRQQNLVVGHRNFLGGNSSGVQTFRARECRICKKCPCSLLWTTCDPGKTGTKYPVVHQMGNELRQAPAPRRSTSPSPGQTQCENNPAKPGCQSTAHQPVYINAFPEIPPGKPMCGSSRAVRPCEAIIPFPC